MNIRTEHLDDTRRDIASAYKELEGLHIGEALRHLSNATWALNDSIRDVVAHARDLGWTWDAIGDTFGVSKQAAQQRWGGE